MGDVAELLWHRLLTKVGKKAVGDGECFALVDRELKKIGAKSAEDFGTVTVTADYVWGIEVSLSDVQPGDVLQFRDHVVTVRTETPQGWKERTYTRGHHTSVVVAVNGDGSVVVVEQKVKPNPKQVSKNTIARLPAGEETRAPDKSTTMTIIVTGTVKAYRPVPKEKGAFLFQLDDVGGERRRIFASFVPVDGGPSRPVGPLGLG